MSQYLYTYTWRQKGVWSGSRLVWVFRHVHALEVLNRETSAASSATRMPRPLRYQRVTTAGDANPPPDMGMFWPIAGSFWAFRGGLGPMAVLMGRWSVSADIWGFIVHSHWMTLRVHLTWANR